MNPYTNMRFIRLKLLACMCVLSACNTGSGKVRMGEGPRNLAWAFRKAGCPNILMSLWPAHDESSGSLIPLYIKFLKEGHDKRKALTLAREEYFHEYPHELSSPFYWANFVLIGDRWDFQAPRSPTPWKYWVLTGFVLATLGLMWYRRKY